IKSNRADHRFGSRIIENNLVARSAPSYR
ncbi:hypothetical protein MPH_14181, partial [Macrophomina phaseolina MS6]